MLYRIYCHFITWICSIMSNVLVYLQTLCCWILPRKKCMTSWQEKSLLVCLWSSLSASPLIFFLFPSSPPHTFYHLCNEASPVLSFSFLSFCFVQLINPLKPNKRKELAYFVLWWLWSCRLLMFFLNELQSLWRLLRGRSHTLPWRLRDSLRGP